MRRHVHRLAHGLERQIDRRRASVPGGVLSIHPYHGFGRGNEMLLRGRVVVDKQISRATSAEPVWRNILNTYKRFQSDEVAGAAVVARYRDAVLETVTDDEGYFQVRLEPQELDPTLLWHDVGLELPGRGVAALGKVIIPAAAELGVISDIDDTIVQTGATSLRKMVRSILLQNAAMRPPFEGVAGLYRALHRDRNPIFYVSSSPWNLYDLIHDFMDLNGIPHGPMFLQDWGLDEETLLTDAHSTHKLAQIQTLLDYYPGLSFVLIGDSGQHDPEIYLEVIRTRADRLKAVIIRDVTVDVRDRAVTHLAEEAKASGIEMLYVQDSKEALAHAQRLGLV